MMIKKVEGCELYRRFPQQTKAQRCYVELDARDGGSLSAEYNPEIGNAVPFAVHYGNVLRFSIPALRADAATCLLAEIAPLAERVVAGYSAQVDWNGNPMGKFDTDAAEAISEIEDLCDRAGGEGEEIVIWDASCYLGGLGSVAAQASELGITPDTTDEELATIAERVLKGAMVNDIDGIHGLEEHLEYLREVANGDAD